MRDSRRVAGRLAARAWIEVASSRGRRSASRVVAVLDHHEPVDLVLAPSCARPRSSGVERWTVIAGLVIRWRTARPGQLAHRYSVAAGADEVGLR